MSAAKSVSMLVVLVKTSTEMTLLLIVIIGKDTDDPL
jgi:hypothetical protein